MNSQKQWLEISLEVDGELAEAVAEVLSRYIQAGIVLEENLDRKGTPVGQIRVAGYLPIDGQLDATRTRIEESLWYLGRIRELPGPHYRTIQDTDWTESWKKNFQPIPVGERLLIAPSWVAPDPRGRLLIRIDPGMAFGTGTHPTTQLALEFLETAVVQDQPVIDVGCGSGILSIAALKLGASQVFAVDPDPEAIWAAQANAVINDLPSSLNLLQGSVGDLLAAAPGPRQAPLVVANILAPVLIELLGSGLGALVSPGGHLILSGILLEQEAAVGEAAAAVGLLPADRRQQLDWVALLFHKPV